MATKYSNELKLTQCTNIFLLLVQVPFSLLKVNTIITYSKTHNFFILFIGHISIPPTVFWSYMKEICWAIFKMRYFVVFLICDSEVTNHLWYQLPEKNKKNKTNRKKINPQLEEIEIIKIRLMKFLNIKISNKNQKLFLWKDQQNTSINLPERLTEKRKKQK